MDRLITIPGQPSEAVVKKEEETDRLITIPGQPSEAVVKKEEETSGYNNHTWAAQWSGS